jgi:hemerythrin-like domain-containing protein
MPELPARRSLLGASIVASGLLLTACSKGEKETGAVEDLMREHGVLRRAFLVFAESAPRLRSGGEVDSAALHNTAKLFREFGEDYHERKLEETYIFPRLRGEGGDLEALVDTLKSQHDRGREITDFVLGATAGARIVADKDALARAFESFGVMYANHTAREDTILFPAWKKALSESELADMGEKFEDIEKQQFGGDGFEDAVRRIAQVEQMLGFAGLAKFTAPKP